MHRLLITFLALLILTACGQKGPLFLPKEEAEPIETNAHQQVSD